MDRRHAVGAVRGDNGQIGHPDVLLLPLLDQADPGEAPLVAGKAGANVVHEPPVDLVDDLEMTRNEELHPFDRPALERLGQQSMIGVGERALGEVESLIPPEMRVVEQNAHELRRRQGGMGIVHLDRRLFGQRPPVRVRLAESANDIAERAGDEEIFLHQPEFAPLHGVIVGVENPGQRFRVERFGDRGDEIAAAEPLKVEPFRGRGAPQPQRVDRLAAIADHRPIIGDANQRRGAVRDHPERALTQFERASERHFDAFGWAHHLPRVRMFEPIVRAFLLPAVAYFLLEDAMLVAQSIAHRRQLHRRHRVKEAGRQPAEAAIAQPGVGLLVKDLPPFAAVAAETLLDDRIEHEVHDIVAERTADEKLDREIVDPLRILARVGLVRA